jgi:hypothetical protein
MRMIIIRVSRGRNANENHLHLEVEKIGTIFAVAKTVPIC